MPTQIQCSNCGADIGEYTERDNKVMLQIGPVVLSDAWGWCGKCGKSWAWNSSDKQLDQLLERVRALRDGKNT